MRRVTAPDGRVWLIRTRLPRPRWRGVSPWNALDPDNPAWAAFAESLGGIVAGILLLAVTAVVIALFLPALVFLAELPLLVGGLLFFGRPCAVEAWPVDNEHEKRIWRVRGWQAARLAVDEVARELQQGVEAAPDDRLLA